LRAAADSASTFARPVAAGVPGILGRYALQRHALDTMSRPDRVLVTQPRTARIPCKGGAAEFYAPHGLHRTHPPRPSPQPTLRRPRPTEQQLPRGRDSRGLPHRPSTVRTQRSCVAITAGLTGLALVAPGPEPSAISRMRRGDRD